MNSVSRFKIASSQIVQESFETEVVIVNLDTGAYFSIEAFSAVIWRALLAGATFGEICDFLTRKATGNVKDIERDVRSFVMRLIDEQIIAVDASPVEESQLRDISWKSSEEISAPWRVPMLQKYTDMQELLLLDPIHEVDATGWPHAKQQG